MHGLTGFPKLLKVYLMFSLIVPQVVHRASRSSSEQIVLIILSLKALYM